MIIVGCVRIPVSVSNSPTCFWVLVASPLMHQTRITMMVLKIVGTTAAMATTMTVGAMAMVAMNRALGVIVALTVVPPVSRLPVPLLSIPIVTVVLLSVPIVAITLLSSSITTIATMPLLSRPITTIPLLSISIVAVALLSSPVTTFQLLSPPMILLMHPPILPPLIIVWLFRFIMTPVIPSSIRLPLLLQSLSVGFPLVMSKVYFFLELKCVAHTLYMSLSRIGQAS